MGEGFGGGVEGRLPGSNRPFALLTACHSLRSLS